VLRSSVILGRLKTDLKDAMRAKDKQRLNVLRSLMAEITNASKTAKPVDSDAKLLALLKKQAVAAEKAVEEFESAQRPDLVEKERAQLQVLQAYHGEIPMLKGEEVDSLVDSVVAELRGESNKEEGWKPPFGALMKGVMAKIAGRPVDQSYVTEKTKSAAA
jgi:uncharacterized protein YqeY